jgi:ribosomal protein S18 acetylase RimI-like enzyme
MIPETPSGAEPTARMIREFTLPRTGDTGHIEVLGVEHLAQVLALQDETRSALPAAQKMFVLPQSTEYFSRLLERRNGLMIGIRVKGQLVSQMAMMGPLTLEDAMAQGAVTRNEVPFHHAETFDLIVVAKSMAVHPDWRGNELSQHMLEAALDQPFARTADHVFAQISVDNVHSWELFLRHGFGIVAAAIDSSDSKPRFVLQKPALGFALRPAASLDNIDSSADFAAIMRLTGREALIGQLDDSGNSPQLAFHAGSDTAAAWVEDSNGLAQKK